jgi:hypothetical protein
MLMYRGMGADDSAASRTLTFDPVTITGEPPKSLAAQVLPWVIGLAVLGTVYYFASGANKRRRRARAAGAPFAG